MLPKFLQSYFWDIDCQKLDPKKYPQFILERILNYGNERSLRWAKSAFSEQKIKKAVLASRALDRKSRSFWFLIFGLGKKTLCFKKLSPAKQSRIWPY